MHHFFTAAIEDPLYLNIEYLFILLDLQTILNVPFSSLYEIYYITHTKPIKWESIV